MSDRKNLRSVPKPSVPAGVKGKPFGQDDAIGAIFVTLLSLALGGLPMAFRHAQFMLQACLKLHELKRDARFLLWLRCLHCRMRHQSTATSA